MASFASMKFVPGLLAAMSTLILVVQLIMPLFRIRHSMLSRCGIQEACHSRPSHTMWTVDSTA